MYNNDYNPIFIRKLALMCIFAFWFCSCLVLHTVDKGFFNYDYSKKNAFELDNPEEYYGNIKGDLAKLSLVAYEEIAGATTRVFSNISGFLKMVTENFGSKSNPIITAILLLIPYLAAFCIMLFLACYIDHMLVVLGSFMGSFVISFTIIFNSFAGNNNIDTAISYNAIQVATYGSLNALIFYFFFIGFLSTKRK